MDAMRIFHAAAFVTAAGLTLSCLAAGPHREDRLTDREPAEQQQADLVSLMIRDWPEHPRLVARAMMEKYGPPDLLGPTFMEWAPNSSWLRIVVFRFAAATDPTGEDEVLAQSVSYVVPQSKRDALSEFGHNLRYDPQSFELTSRSASEEANFLALNLADDIVGGRKEVDDAVRFFRKTLAQAQAGRWSPYLEKLLFKSPAQRRRPAAAPRLDRF
jgi:hypothetical protein